MDRSTAMLHSAFREYYSSWEPDGPDNISSREIGLIPFEGTMVRHRKFRSLLEARAMCARDPPRHLYYSSAYYRKPDERSMEGKGWLGAELIFDLDADHIPGASNMSYEAILGEVKKHTIRLVKNFLIGSLGVPRDSIKVYFSGGRGYHVHIQDDAVYTLDSDSRREIADYVRGEGITFSEIRKNSFLLSGAMGGWISSIDRFVSSVFAEVYRGSNIGILKDDELSDILSRRNSPVIVDRTRTASREQVLSSPGHLKYRLDISEAEQKVFEWATTTYLERERSEIDEPVTTDVHRLIRFPMSLHGKSGLMVLPVPLDGLEEFDPLVSAVPERFRDGECRVELPAGFSVWFMGRKFELDAGVHSVDRALGIFLVASGRAKFV